MLYTHTSVEPEILLSVIAGYIAAQNDVWLCGDEFLNNLFPILQELCDSAKDAHEPIPYLYQYYNITRITEEKMSTNKTFLSRVINSITRGLQNQPKLPRYIIMLIDADLVQFVNHFGFSISHILGSCLEWLMKNLDCVISSKKDTLCRRQPGAIKSGEPKIIWVTMAYRPEFCLAVNKKVAAAPKFNAVLADLVRDRKGHLFMDLHNKITSPLNFNKAGYLNQRGKEVYWQEIDRKLEEFDYNKTDLVPMQVAKPSIHVLPLQQSRRKINPMAASHFYKF